MKTNILTHLLYLYGQGSNFERVPNLMVKFLGSQFWGSEKGFAVFHQYRMQIPFIPHLPIKHLHSPVLSHRTVTVGGTEFSNVLAHYLQFVSHGPVPGFGFGKSGPQKMKSSTSDRVGFPCKLVIREHAALPLHEPRTHTAAYITSRHPESWHRTPSWLMGGRRN